MCVMDFVSHRGIILILIRRSVMQCVCLCNVYMLRFHSMTKYPLLKSCFSYSIHFQAVTSSNLVVLLKLCVGKKSQLMIFTFSQQSFDKSLDVCNRS